MRESPSFPDEEENKPSHIEFNVSKDYISKKTEETHEKAQKCISENWQNLTLLFGETTIEDIITKMVVNKKNLSLKNSTIKKNIYTEIEYKAIASMQHAFLNKRNMYHTDWSGWNNYKSLRRVFLSTIYSCYIEFIEKNKKTLTSIFSANSPSIKDIFEPLFKQLHVFNADNLYNNIFPKSLNNIDTPIGVLMALPNNTRNKIINDIINNEQFQNFLSSLSSLVANRIHKPVLEGHVYKKPHETLMEENRALITFVYNTSNKAHSQNEFENYAKKFPFASKNIYTNGTSEESVTITHAGLYEKEYLDFLFAEIVKPISDRFYFIKEVLVCYNSPHMRKYQTHYFCKPQ